MKHQQLSRQGAHSSSFQCSVPANPQLELSRRHQRQCESHHAQSSGASHPCSHRSMPHDVVHVSSHGGSVGSGGCCASAPKEDPVDDPDGRKSGEKGRRMTESTAVCMVR